MNTITKLPVSNSNQLLKSSSSVINAGQKKSTDKSQEISKLTMPMIPPLTVRRTESLLSSHSLKNILDLIQELSSSVLSNSQHLTPIDWTKNFKLSFKNQSIVVSPLEFLTGVLKSFFKNESAHKLALFLFQNFFLKASGQDQTSISKIGLSNNLTAVDATTSTAALSHDQLTIDLHFLVNALLALAIVNCAFIPVFCLIVRYCSPAANTPLAYNRLPATDHAADNTSTPNNAELNEHQNHEITINSVSRDSARKSGEVPRSEKTSTEKANSQTQSSADHSPVNTPDAVITVDNLQGVAAHNQTTEIRPSSPTISDASI